ncbi:MAG: FHA domain-containing protein [Acutalibacteraceae bacterium]
MGVVTAISRYILPFLTVVILTKCMLSLFLGHPKEKIYGYIIDTTDGQSYPLNMWETSIGRSNSCDIVIGYDTVSRFQAVISRRIDGWYVYDLFSKSGIMVNGEKIDKKTTIKNGDVLTFGIVQYRFMVTDDPVVRVGKKKGKRASSKDTPRFDERPYSPSKTTSPFDERPYTSSKTTPPFSEPDSHYKPEDFYDYNNKPNLNFDEKDSYKNSSYYASSDSSKYSDDIFSNMDIFTVETPGRADEKHYTYTGTRPAVINKDTGETYVLCGDLVSIGRSRTNDIKLLSPTVSRHHADLVLYEDGWAIVDANSSSGTFLNGNRISQPQLLFDGDVIAISDERLFYTVNPSAQKQER